MFDKGFTQFHGQQYNNSPHEDVFKKFQRDDKGRLDLTNEGAVERAKIARDHGFLVDPFTGKGFWVAGHITQLVNAVDPTKKSGGLTN